jgi:hypothetical protein
LACRCSGLLASLSRDVWSKSMSKRVNTLSWATVISDCALAVPGIWFVHRAGLRVVFLVCSGLNFAGCVIRFFAVFAGVNSTYFSLLLVGQVLGALAQPVLNSVPPQVKKKKGAHKKQKAKLF